MQLRSLRFVAFFLLCATRIALGANLRLLTEDYPPYSTIDRNALLGGPAVEKVRELMKRTGLSYTIESMPWPRAYENTLNQSDTCVFSTVRSAQRESRFQWIGPIFGKYQMAIFGRTGDPRQPKHLEELHPYTMGSYTRGAVAEYLTSKGFHVDLADSDNFNPQKLLMRRFDFWAAGKTHAMAILHEQHMENKIVLLFEFQHAEMYLACNRNMAHDNVELLRHQWSAMQADGTASAIDRKYALQ